jgi:sec-independent protein translocase protein TatA
MFGLRPAELIIILLIVLLLFGAKRLPDTARSLGRSLRIFKSETKAMREEDDLDAERERRAEPSTPPPAPPRQITAAQGDVTEPRPVGEPDHTDR